MRRKITAAERLSAQVPYVREADLRPGARHSACGSPFGAKLFSKACFLASGVTGPSPARGTGTSLHVHGVAWEGC